MPETAVDVVIAARNEAPMLSECLSAIAGQDYRGGPIRIIVIDDHSTDATDAVATGKGALVLRSRKSGAGAARNVGIHAGDASLIAFLDAHSIPDAHWIRILVSRFDDPRLGGCQAQIENRSTSQLVDSYLRTSGLHSNDDILQQTVSGQRSLYPWVLTGNCMYRRCALEDAGYFDEGLVASEDVDLAWRTVLAGWVLGYDGRTGVVHHDGNSWSGFLRKGWKYGRGAAQLTRAYGAHGARGKFDPRGLRRPSRPETVTNLYYWSGFNFQRLVHRPTIALRPVTDVQRFRDPFDWRAGMALRVSRRAVYWFREAVSVVVQLDRRERILLDRVGDFVWRRIVNGASHEQLVEAIVETYRIRVITAASDLDDLIDEMVGLGILEEVPAG